MRLHSLLLLLLSLTATAKTYSVSSPDGKLCMNINVSETLSFSLFHESDTLLFDSNIRIDTDRGLFGNGFRVRKAEFSFVDESFPTPVYKRSRETDRYRQLRLVGRDGYDVIFRVYDEGAAYRFVSTGKDPLTVYGEQAGFNFGEDRMAWVPYVRKTGDFEKQFFNTFENTYVHDRLSAWRSGQLAFLPVLVESTGGKKICLTESELEHYPGMYLYNYGEGNILTGVFAPYPKTERQGSHDPSVTVGGHNKIVVERESFIARVPSGYAFPWRVFAVSTKDSDLLDNNLVYKLARPSVVEDTSWIRPGLVSWEWWNDRNVTGVDFKAGINNKTYEYYIDFASENGIPYVVLDEGWYDKMAGDAFAVIPDIDLDALIRYGEQKNVGLILWVGYYVFQKDMERVISEYAARGIKGFKLDAIGRDDQILNEFYYTSAELARKNKVVLDFHGGAKPAGLNRTYPNVLNFEGVHGLEQLKNKSYECDLVTYDVTFPFIRSISGPVDYTQGAMRNGTRETFRGIWSEPMSQGTRCRQLAEYIVFESPLNMLCDSPGNYRKEQECTDYITSLPTVWKETLPLDGETGRFLVLAREDKEGNWHVGGLGGWESRDVSIPLHFLPEGSFRAEIFCDGANAAHNAADYRHRFDQVSRSDTLQLWMAPGGGFAIRLTPSSGSSSRLINRYGLDLVPKAGGYALKDEQKIISYKLFDLSTAPGDLYTPFTRSRLFLKDDDFHQVETKEAVFKRYPGYELKLAVDLPKEKGDAPLPFIVWIHGGGWHMGDYQGMANPSRFLAGNGIAGVRISYSLLTQGARFRDTWQDIRDAVQFIRSHAEEYGLDPGRFGFAGHSAGGHLAAYAAMRIPESRLMVSFNGIYDLVHTVPDFVPSHRHDTYFGLDSIESRKEASPVTFVHPGAPFCILTYSSGDTLVDKQQIETFCEALRANNVPFERLEKDYYSHTAFIDTDLLEPTLMHLLITAQKYL